MKLQSVLLCFAAFVAATHGYSLSCMFSQMNWGSPVGNRFGGSCNFDFTDNDYVNLVQVTDGMVPIATTNVQYLSLYGSGSTMPGPPRLPSNLKTLFPDLVYLQWAGAGLRQLSASDLSSWPNLLTANFMSNNLRSLDANVFTNNPNLRTMDFSMNPLEVIGDGFFMGLNKLTQVSFMSVKCMGMSYMGSQTDIESQKSDIQHLCGPLVPVGASTQCAADCEGLFTGIDKTLASVTKGTTSAEMAFYNILYNIH